MLMTDRKKTERFLIQGWYQNQRKVDAKINTRLVKKSIIRMVLRS